MGHLILFWRGETCDFRMLEVLVQRRGDLTVTSHGSVMLRLDKNRRDTIQFISPIKKTRGAPLNRASPLHVSETMLQRKMNWGKIEGR